MEKNNNNDSSMEKLQAQQQLKHRQSSRHILMVRPSFFTSNQDTIKDNVFMALVSDKLDTQQKAVAEWDLLVNKLRTQTSITIHVVDSHDESCPDSCFPNNVFSTHRTAQDVVTTFWYPMKAPSRRKERSNPKLSPSIYSCYEQHTTLSVVNEDLTEYEKQDKHLEGTGSLVLDRVNKIAYMAASQRSDTSVAEAWISKIKLNFKLVSFSAECDGKSVYHTNVLMSVGSKYAIVCTSVFKNETELDSVKESLKNTGKILIEISENQMKHFCGNVLELDESGVEEEEEKLVMVLSQDAMDHFTEEQVEKLKECGIRKFISSDIGTIERIGGGSARCLIAELEM